MVDDDISSTELEAKLIRDRDITMHVVHQMNILETDWHGYSEEDLEYARELILERLHNGLMAMEIYHRRMMQQKVGDYANTRKYPIDPIANVAEYWDKSIEYLSGDIERLEEVVLRNEDRWKRSRRRKGQLTKEEKEEMVLHTIASWKENQTPGLREKLESDHLDLTMRAYHKGKGRNRRMHILEIMRVKDFERAVNKIARRVCEARETYRTGLKRKLEDKNSSGRYYIMDVIANIHYRLEGEPTGMRLEEEEIIRIAEGIIEAQYVSAVAETVWDWFGVKYVVEDLPTVNVLVSDAINLGAGFIPDKGMVRKRIRGQLKKSQYVWVTGTSVDNHYYLPPSDKNNMIFTSIRTDPSILGFSERLDLCFTRFRDYIFDELGEGCHHLYEGRQIDKMRSHSSAIVRDGYEELHRRGFELITPEFRGQVQSMLVNGI